MVKRNVGWASLGSPRPRKYQHQLSRAMAAAPAVAADPAMEGERADGGLGGRPRAACRAAFAAVLTECAPRSLCPPRAPLAVDIFGDGGGDDDLGEEIARADTDEIAQRARMLENEIKVIKNEQMRLNHEHQAQKEKIKENTEKIKLNKQLPYLVANVVELLDMELEDEVEEDGANIDLDAHRKGTCCVLKTSTRQTIFLPVPGLVETEKLKPADLVGVNKDSYLILEVCARARLAARAHPRHRRRRRRRRRARARASPAVASTQESARGAPGPHHAPAATLQLPRSCRHAVGGRAGARAGTPTRPPLPPNHPLPKAPPSPAVRSIAAALLDTPARQPGGRVMSWLRPRRRACSTSSARPLPAPRAALPRTCL